MVSGVPSGEDGCGEGRFDDVRALETDLISVGGWRDGDAAGRFVVFEQDAASVVAGEPGLDLVRFNQLMKRGFALGIVVVGAGASGEESEAVHGGQGHWAGIGHALLEPANHSGTFACEDGSIFPSFFEER